MAERLGLGTHDRIHHFVSAGDWNAAPLLEELARKADDLPGGDDAVLAVDDTALPKKGTASVGVAPQCALALGKQADCRILVSPAPSCKPEGSPAQREKKRTAAPPPERLPAFRRAVQQLLFGSHSHRCPHCSRSLAVKPHPFPHRAIA